MAPFVMICLLDARQIPDLSDFIGYVQQVKSAAGDEVVLFLLSFPVQNIARWHRKLTETFASKGVIYCCGDESGTPTGQIVLQLGEAKANTKLSHVQIIECSPDYDCMVFGLTMIYVVLRFSSTKKATGKTVGILWQPDVFCVDKLCISDANWRGIDEFMQEWLAWNRYQKNYADDDIEIPRYNNSIRCPAQKSNGAVCSPCDKIISSEVCG